MRLLFSTSKVIDGVSITITPIEDTNGNLYFLPKEIEGGLEYNDLSVFLTMSPGFVKDADYKVFPEDEIKEIKGIDGLGFNLTSKTGLLILLTESGLCNVLLKSWKPLARNIHAWLTNEVLPNIERGNSVESLPITFKKNVKNVDYILQGEFNF